MCSKIKFLINLIILLVLVSACVSGESNQTSVAAATAQTTLNPFALHTETATQVSATAMPEPVSVPPLETPVVPTEMFTSNPGSVKECIPFMNDFPVPEDKHGRFVLMPRPKYSDDEKKGFYLFDLKSGEKKVLPVGAGPFSAIYASPDGKKLAYNRFDPKGSESVVYLFTPDGSVEKEIHLKGGVKELKGWRNNQQLIFSWQREQGSDKIYLDYAVYDLTLATTELVHTPILKKEVIGGSDFPARFDEFTFLDSLNENLDHVLFFSFRDDFILSENGYGIWDVLQQKSLFFKSDQGFLSWYDASHAVVQLTTIDKQYGFMKEFFMVDTDGLMRQLTFLNIKPEEKSFNLLEYSISPDKQKLAFYASPTSGETPASLFIYDFKTGQTIDTCIEKDITIGLGVKEMDFFYYYGPVWSPDSQHVLVERRYKPDASRILLVDLKDQYVVPITQNIINKVAVAWLDEGEEINNSAAPKVFSDSSNAKAETVVVTPLPPEQIPYKGANITQTLPEWTNLGEKDLQTSVDGHVLNIGHYVKGEAHAFTLQEKTAPNTWHVFDIIFMDYVWPNEYVVYGPGACSFNDRGDFTLLATALYDERAAESGRFPPENIGEAWHVNRKTLTWERARGVGCNTEQIYKIGP